jgi:SH3 domain-containing YSC84-like protein 1
MKNIVKMVVPTVLMSAILILSVPVWAADKANDDQTIRNAANVLQAMVDSKDIPHGVISKADCIIVLPSVKKFAVGIGGTGGRGPMSCREGENYRGKWSAPAMYTLGGMSAGLQLGGTASDVVLLIMAPSAVDKVLNGKVKVGSDASAAAGPGASAGSDFNNADILTYSRSKGLFAGISLNGATLDPDTDANARIYGKDLSASQIVKGGAKANASGMQLTSLLDSHIH